MMRVAVVIAGNGRTGAPRRLLSLAHQLRLAGVDASIVAHGKHEINDIARLWRVPCDELEAPVALRKGVLSGSFASKFFKFFMVLLFWLRQVIFFSRNQYDVIVLRSSLSGILYFPVYLLWGKRVVLDIDYEVQGGLVVAWSRRIAIHFCAVIIAQYSSVLEQISAGIKVDVIKRKFFSILPGIDVVALSAKAKARSMKLPSEPLVISHIGSICDRKNQLFSLRLLAQMVSDAECPLVVLRLVGGVDDEVYQDSLKNYVGINGLEDLVEFCGWRDDVSGVMAESDILLMPSRNEGVPNTIQEAMCLGVPVLASDAGGIPDVIVDGQSGFVIPLSQPDRWYECLKALICQPDVRSRLSVAAKDRAVRDFSLSHWAAAYLAVINKNIFGLG